MADHVGLSGGWAKTETPVTQRRSRSAKDLREGTFRAERARRARAEVIRAQLNQRPASTMR